MSDDVRVLLSQLPYRGESRWPLLTLSDRALLDVLRYSDTITDRDRERLRALMARLEWER